MAQYFYNTKEMENRLAGEKYATTNGAWVDGERIIFGKLSIPAGTGADPHSHPNEQFIIILGGQARIIIEGEERVVGEGDMIHIPVGAVHSTKVIGDEELTFVTAKDTSWGIQGIPEDEAAK
jgi:quercetin dioxygenase-like cupin family protein